MNFPDEIELEMDPCEPGGRGCMITRADEILADEGHCDSKDAEDEDE